MAENIKWLSVAKLSQDSGVPESTTRRYLNRFDKFMRYDNRSRGRRYHPACVDIVTLIQQLYADGMETEEVEETLAKKYAINAECTESSSIEPSPVAHSFATKEDMAELQQLLVRMNEEIAAVREENEQLQAMIDEKFVEHEKKMVSVIEELGSRAEKHRKSFWGRLFGK